LLVNILFMLPRASSSAVWKALSSPGFLIHEQVLNSQLYKDSSRAADAAAAQESWLDLTLAGKAARFTVAFAHIPPFISDPDEADGYFPLAKSVRRPLLRKLSSGGVGHVFCGHYHRNAGGFYRGDGDGGGGVGSAAVVEVVTTAAVGGNITTRMDGGDPLGLTGMGSVVASASLTGVRIVTMAPQGVRHRFVSLVDLEAQVATDE